MTRHPLALLALTALALLAAPAAGATKYVRTSGSNANSGNSPSQAWATVAYAATQVSAGDVVYVGAGTYSQGIAPSVSGTSSNRIRFVADTAGTATGDAGAVLLRRFGLVIQAQNDDYLTFEGFTIENTSTAGAAVQNDSCDWLTFDSCTIIGGQTTVNTYNGGSTRLDDCSVSGGADHGVQQAGGTLVMNGTTVEDVGAGDRGVSIYNSATATISGCFIYAGNPGIRIDGGTTTIVNTVIYGADVVHAIQTVNSCTVSVINCTIGGVTGDGLHQDGGTLTVRNNIFFSIGDDCMDLDGGTITASHNIAWVFGSERSEGFDSVEIEANPMLTDPAGRDFTLQAGSPAIDAGWNASGFTSVDAGGGARPVGGGWDIGAYEFGAVGVVPADVPYATDFSDHGEEWENALHGVNGTVGDYIGRYGRTGGVQTSTTLHLNTTPGMTHIVTFDLLLIDSWDGDHASYGPDTFEVRVDGVAAFDESFSHHEFTHLQSYPFPANATGNWGWGGYREGRYDAVTFSFVASGEVTELTFIGGTDEDIGNESWALLGVEVVEDPPVFVDATTATNFGVDTNAGLHDGSGWLWSDIDGDGDLDAFVTGAPAYTLRYNSATGQFTQILLGSYRRGAALLDTDGDGDPDAFNANEVALTLLENLGGLLVSRGAVGVDGPTNAETVAAIDIDTDGDVDLVIFADNGTWIALNNGAGFDGFSPVGFADDKDTADGLNSAGDWGNGDYASSADVNNDGHLDFFYHYNSGKLFLSDGDGTYTRANGGISVYTHNDSKFGSAWGDYDNDGDMDLFVPDARDGHAGSLWRNSSDGGSFTNVAAAAGITSTAAMRSATWGDYNNDGHPDLYITTAAGTPNLLYTNNGDGTFTLESLGAGLTGDFQDAVFVDFDNDGDLDIALTRIDGDGRTVLLENQTDNDAYLKVRLVGTGSVNTLAIGARVELWNADASAILGMREIGTARGYGGIEPLWAHFGGTDPAATYTLRVVWPGGTVQTQPVVPQDASTTIGAQTIDQMVTVTAQPAGVRYVQWREVDPTE